MRFQINITEAERSVGIRGEVDGIVRMAYQTQEKKGASPHRESDDMQDERQEDGPTKQQQCPDKLRFLCTKAPYPALVQYMNTVEASAMKKHEKYQQESTDEESRHRLEFIRDLGQ
jgi:hypothetical protein